MVKDSFEISYAAHTASCTFLLDAEGICRRIVMVPQSGKRRESSRSAARCVGAQYVASLDAGAAGGLVEMPRVGAAMLFARVDERGRVSLVRTGVVTSFEAKQAPDPFVDSSSVETSAPALNTPQPATPRVDPDDYFDASDRTARMPAMPLRDDELATAEYQAAEDFDQPVSSARPPRPSHVAPSPTLRAPHREALSREALSEEDDSDAYASSANRGMLPRRDQYVGSAARARIPEPQRTPRTRPYPNPAPSDVVVSRRRRG